MFSLEKLNALSKYLDSIDSKSALFLGVDSVKFKKRGKWYATYTAVAVVHIDNRFGCRVFAESITEPDYDQNKSKPTMRLLNEAMKVSELYNELKPLMLGREVEIHLDISPYPIHGSNHVLDQAVGYVRGVTGVEPKVKPESWAATHAADRHMRGPQNAFN